MMKRIGLLVATFALGAMLSGCNGTAATKDVKGESGAPVGGTDATSGTPGTSGAPSGAGATTPGAPR